MKSIRKTVENVLVMARGTPSGLVTQCVCEGEAVVPAQPQEDTSPPPR